MKNYKELCRIYKPVFLHYIINRSKDTARRLHLDYDDLIQDGLFKLVKLYSDDKKYEDAMIMQSLVNLYNDILGRSEFKMTFIPLDQVKVEDMSGEEE